MQATKAQYENVYNPGDGIIYAIDNYSPAYRTRNQPDFRLTPLRQWSDVAFLEWQESCKEADDTPVSNLRKVWRVNIDNKDTQWVISNSLKHDKTPEETVLPPYWKNAVTFSMESDAGKALIATPNGGGLVWLLITHRQVLGKKRIKSVRVFSHQPIINLRNPNPDLLFELEDIPTVEPPPTKFDKLRRADTPADPEPKSPIEGKTYQDYICKGELLLSYISKSAEELEVIMGKPSQSPWTKYDDLKQYGWTKHGPNPVRDNPGSERSKMLHDLGLDPGTGTWNLNYIWTHSKGYMVDGVPKNVCSLVRFCSTKANMIVLAFPWILREHFQPKARRHFCGCKLRTSFHHQR